MLYVMFFVHSGTLTGPNNHDNEPQMQQHSL